MATPIRHTTCGEIVMWYMGEKDDNVVKSSNIVYLNGTRPAVCSAVPKCPVCGGGIYPGLNLRRCFDEDVDPGFDIQEAWRNGKRVSLPPGPPNPLFAAMLTHDRNVARWVFGLMAAWFLIMVIVAASTER